MFLDSTILDFFIKAILALFVGSVIGFERESKSKPAGVKTHALISFGAMIFTYISYNMSSYGDPTRIAAQVVSGVGFLGAGTIFMSKFRVSGLTSAATVWVCASLGMALGSGFIAIPLISLTLIISTIYISNFLKSDINHYAVKMEIEDWDTLKEVAALITQHHLKIKSKKLERKDGLWLDLHYSTNPTNQHMFMKKLYHLDGLGQLLKI
ncbi:MAG: MgtC/SapB family protein [bacterium]|nr:MgtC/SapB family protein [bacterium]